MEHSIGIKNKLEGDLFKVSRFKEVIKRTKPHKHEEYYELIFLFEGEGFHSIESERYLVEAPECYVLKPGQLHYWQFTSIPKGFVILFKESIIDTINETVLLKSLSQLSTVSKVKLASLEFYSPLLELMQTEFANNHDYSKDVMHGLLTALLAKMNNEFELKSNANNKPSGIYERFCALLVSEIPQIKKVNGFAELLFTTPQNLNQICRKQSGQSASEMINNQMLLEAKRYILHTDLTINEISEILNYSDVSNFVKYFKKHLGVTPNQFRERYFQ